MLCFRWGDRGDLEREDIYTRFSTTRIINFLKGISFPGPELELAETLEVARKQSQRAALGVVLLETLLAERRLYAAPKTGFKPLRRFKPERFFRVWSQLNRIRTQAGKVIAISIS